MIMTPQKKNIIQFACFSGAVVGLILILIAVVLMFSKSDEGIIPTLLGTSSQGDTLLEESETNDSSETPSATESDPDPDPDPTPDLPPEESSDGNGGGSSSSGGSSTQQVKPVKAVVKTVNGMPQLYINNKLTMPILFFGNTDRNDRYDITTHEARLAAAGGIRLHTMISNLNYSDLTNPKLLYMDYLNDCNTIIEGDPSAKIMVRINIGQYNTTGVKDSEIMKFVGGEEKDYKLVSIASDEWFEDAKKRLADMVKYTRSSPELADHVFGWHLENGEWFQYMFREAGTDISEANDRKFREWLTDKYKTDAALSKAWGGNYTLATAQVPRDLPNNISSARYSDTLLLKDTQTRFVDYLDYVGWLVSSRIEGLAKTIKEASNNENIVISFYGYFYELCDAQSGHFSMRPLLESEYLDGFASPVTYGDRSGGLSSGGATSAYMTAVESVARNGKIWFSESDQRTYISRGGDPLDTFCTPIMSISAIQEVHKREIGSNMVHGTGMYAMDLTANGWLDDSRIWKNIGKLSKLNLAYVNARKKAPEFEVALVVDEKAESIVGDPVALSFQTLSQARYNLYRAGVRFSMVELEDVLNGKANEYKVYIFANPYRLSSETVEKLNSRIHRDNKISVFMYSFGRTSAADVKN